MESGSFCIGNPGYVGAYPASQTDNPTCIVICKDARYKLQSCLPTFATVGFDSMRGPATNASWLRLTHGDFQVWHRSERCAMHNRSRIRTLERLQVAPTAHARIDV